MGEYGRISGARTLVQKALKIPENPHSAGCDSETNILS